MYTGQVAVFSNREDWIFPPMELVDADTGESLDLSAATIVYGIYDPDGCQVLTDTVASANPFQVFVARSSVTSRCAGTYELGITVEIDSITTSLIAGSIAVINGNVPA